MIHQRHESARALSHPPAHTAVAQHGAPSEAAAATFGKGTRAVVLASIAGLEIKVQLGEDFHQCLSASLVITSAAL
ncbi:hypothetical protein AALO_G00004650 [Alosa alosa]|uniref:Uncharacterized protein n=1 Tax=Alosa alosa TaxID=278164 RepID=A0AAV6HDV6_9TELE|nr:hypothetical protein AALO_G00004650 [Alosa alosa]